MSDSEESVHGGDPEPASSRRKKKEYSVKFKLQVVEWATANRNNKGVHAAAEHFGVSRKNVRRWLAQAAKLKERKVKAGGKNAKNLPGGGRLIKNKGFEKKRTKGERMKGEGRTPRAIQGDLSHGWLEKFMKRNNWTLRATTSVAQKPPADYQDKVVRFVIAVEAVRKLNKFLSKHVYGADETGVWISPTGGLCVEQIGHKDVTVLSAGNTKLRITVMLTLRPVDASQGLRISISGNGNGGKCR